MGLAVAGDGAPNGLALAPEHALQEVDSVYRRIRDLEQRNMARLDGGVMCQVVHDVPPASSHEDAWLVCRLDRQQVPYKEQLQQCSNAAVESDEAISSLHQRSQASEQVRGVNRFGEVGISYWPSPIKKGARDSHCPAAALYRTPADSFHRTRVPPVDHSETGFGQ